MTHALPPAAIAKIVAVLAEEPLVQRVTLYGSRAKGCAKPGSDIDLAISAPQADRQLLLRLDQRLDDLLLPWKIDFNFIHLIHSQDLLEHICRVGVVWFDRDRAARGPGIESPPVTHTLPAR